MGAACTSSNRAAADGTESGRKDMRQDKKWMDNNYDRAMVIDSLKSNTTMQHQNLLNEDIEDLVDNMQTYQYRSGEAVIVFGEPANDFICLQKGAVDIYSNTGVKINTLEGPIVLGEMGFFSGSVRNATIKASRNCIVHKIGYEQYYKLTERSSLKKAPILANLSVTDLGKLLPYATIKTYEDGEVIVSSGAKPTGYWYLISAGFVDVDKGKKMLPVGEHFGEQELLNKEPYSATYQAKGRASVVQVEQKAFESVLDSIRASAPITRKASFFQRGSTKESFAKRPSMRKAAKSANTKEESGETGDLYGVYNGGDEFDSMNGDQVKFVDNDGNSSPVTRRPSKGSVLSGMARRKSFSKQLAAKIGQTNNNSDSCTFTDMWNPFSCFVILIFPPLLAETAAAE
jgi:CRP-like cAMP-binding protein